MTENENEAFDAERFRAQPRIVNGFHDQHLTPEPGCVLCQKVEAAAKAIHAVSGFDGSWPWPCEACIERATVALAAADAYPHPKVARRRPRD